MDILSYALAKAKAAGEYIAKSVLTARGDLLYRDASGPAALAKGTAGQVLTQGANDPEWAAAGGGETSEKKMYYILDELPGDPADQFVGLMVYTTNTLSICTQAGAFEIDELTMTDPPTKVGENTISIIFNGGNEGQADIEIDGGTLDVHNAEITAGASANGNVTVTLNDVPVVVEVTSGLSAADVATMISNAYSADADWTVGSDGAVLTFTAKAVGAKAGAFTLAPAATGVTCTGGITETTPGTAADTLVGMATKIKDAVEAASGITIAPWWSVVQDDEVLTFTRDKVESCAVSSFVDTDTTGASGTFSRINEGASAVWWTVAQAGGGAE